MKYCINISGASRKVVGSTYLNVITKLSTNEARFKNVLYSQSAGSVPLTDQQPSDNQESVPKWGPRYC